MFVVVRKFTSICSIMTLSKPFYLYILIGPLPTTLCNILERLFLSNHDRVFVRLSGYFNLFFKFLWVHVYL